MSKKRRGDALFSPKAVSQRISAKETMRSNVQASRNALHDLDISLIISESVVLSEPRLRPGTFTGWYLMSDVVTDTSREYCLGTKSNGK
jgi:hypothetical protein